MANKHKIHRAGRDRAVAELLETRAQIGYLDRTMYQMAADSCGYSVRQLQRQIQAHDRRDGQDALAEDFIVDPDVIETVFRTCGNLSGAHRSLAGAGVTVPSLSTFRRRVLKEMDGTMLAYATNGSKRGRISRIHLTRGERTRGQSYELDHTELPIYAIPDGYRTAHRPWITAVMDTQTRYVLAWTVTFGTPTAEEVRGALVSAFTLRLASDGATPVGGLPRQCLWDRGLDFLSDLVTESCLRLDVAPVALPGYSPHLKGRIERFWEFLKHDCLGRLPGYIDAGHDVRNNYLLAAKALTEQGLLNEIARWIDWYNTEHVHRSLGCTPLQAWRNDPTELRSAPADQLWQDFLISKAAHKVGKAGVRFRKKDYVGVNGELNKIFGRTAEIRYLPHDDSFIEVFHNGEHIGTCYPADRLRPDDIQAFLEARRKAEAEARAMFRTSNRLRADRDDAVALNKVTLPGGKTRYEANPAAGIDLFHGVDEALKNLDMLPGDEGQGRLL